MKHSCQGSSSIRACLSTYTMIFERKTVNFPDAIFSSGFPICAPKNDQSHPDTFVKPFLASYCAPTPTFQYSLPILLFSWNCAIHFIVQGAPPGAWAI